MMDSMLLLEIGPGAGTLPNTTPVPVRYGSWFPQPHDTSPVPSVTGLTATPVADGILLEWDALDLPDVVYVIERATSQSGQWIELARTSNTHYLVSDPSGDTWFFRVIARVRGRAGSDSTVEGASKVIAGDEDIAELIEKQKEIDEARVLERVELIDLNAEAILEEILRSHEFNDIRRQHADTLNRAMETLEVLIENGQVTAQQVVELFAQLADEVSTRQAQYQQTNTAIADETSARVTAITGLHAQVSTDLSNANAALNQRIDSAEANAESARAATEAALGAQIIAGDTAVSTAFNTRVDEVEATAEAARASLQSALAAQITTGDNLVSTALHTRADQVEANAASARASMHNTLISQISNTQALLQSSIDTKVTSSQAQAIAQTQVQAFQNGNFATLQQSFNVVAGQHNNMYGQWQASYSVKLTGSTFNGQPIIAGISLSANPNSGSDFIVQSDNFYVVTQNASSGLELRNGFLRVFKGSAQRIIGNGFGTSHDLVDYFGPNVGPASASKTNAVMWMDTSGNAMFKGRISAQNIVGEFQQRTAIDWTGLAKTFQNNNGFNDGINLTPVLAEFTLPAPKIVGETHTPYLDVVVEMLGMTASVYVLLEMWSGSAWLPVAQREGPYMHLAWSGNDTTRPLMEKYIPFSAFHTPQAGARTYRIRVTSAYARNPYTNTGLSAYAVRLRGCIIGLR